MNGKCYFQPPWSLGVSLPSWMCQDSPDRLLDSHLLLWAALPVLAGQGSLSLASSPTVHIPGQPPLPRAHFIPETRPVRRWTCSPGFGIAMSHRSPGSRSRTTGPQLLSTKSSFHLSMLLFDLRRLRQTH